MIKATVRTSRTPEIAMNTRESLAPCLTSLLCFGWMVAAAPAQNATVPNTAGPAKKPAKNVVPPPKPTTTDLPYESQTRQVLDFYQAKSEQPTPLVFYIHGGTWMGGDKAKVLRLENGLSDFLAAGISVVAINYRYVSAAQAAGVESPVKWLLEDAARSSSCAPNRKSGILTRSVLGQPTPDPEHSVLVGVKLAKKLTEAGVENYLSYLGGPENPWPNAVQFLIARLNGSADQ